MTGAAPSSYPTLGGQARFHKQERLPSANHDPCGAVDICATAGGRRQDRETTNRQHGFPRAASIVTRSYGIARSKSMVSHLQPVMNGNTSKVTLSDEFHF